MYGLDEHDRLRLGRSMENIRVSVPKVELTRFEWLLRFSFCSVSDACSHLKEPLSRGDEPVDNSADSSPDKSDCSDVDFSSSLYVSSHRSPVVDVR